MTNCYNCNHCEVCRWIDKFKDKGVCDFYEGDAPLTKALEQEPSGDLISRQAFITRYDEWTYSEYGHHAREDALGLRVIKSLPPAKQEPKTGHWITEDMFDGDVAYRCSECNELFWIESGTPKDNEYNFCPKCGAKMIEQKESEDKE